MEIKQVSIGENKGAFVGYSESERAGAMFYTWAGEDRIIIDHTEVEDAFRGQGVGNKLLEATVEFARSKK